jgi:protein gp37
MASSTKIEWTDATWNPVTGCSKISAGCNFCYAERFAERFRGVPDHPFTQGFDLTLRPERLTQPLSWRQSKMVFVNSMSDLFHKEVPAYFVDKVFNTIEKAHWHTFQVLTKRSSRLRDYVNARYASNTPPCNLWLGASVEDGTQSSRVRHMRDTKGSVRFLSIEPLIGPMGCIDLTNIDWVIVGGESGPSARSLNPDWVRSIRDQCITEKVPFFFKQWGGYRPKSGGRELDGREWNELPCSHSIEIQPSVHRRASKGLPMHDGFVSGA